MSSAIVILTGAGISAESGVQTFRGSDGLWKGHRIEEVGSFTRAVRGKAGESLPSLVKELLACGLE
jgi:NAD-dependent SIR2 family protein deacetylase